MHKWNWRVKTAAAIALVATAFAVATFGFFVHSTVLFHYLLAPAIWLLLELELWNSPAFWVLLIPIQFVYYLVIVAACDVLAGSKGSGSNENSEQ